MFENELNILEKLSPLVEMTQKQDIKILARFLYDRISHPDSYLVFLGETSSGKSSVINGLLGDSILPMKAYPTTAAITEVELSEDAEADEYYAINKNATIETIDRQLFLQLSETPDEDLKRLKVIKKVSHRRLNNLRIFDTPGFNSIVQSHEEVLKDFLPNSDIIVYSVSYKVGIQDNDYVFLGYLRELIRPDVKIILLVNRCPLGVDCNDMKITKISQWVSDILTIDPVIFTIPIIDAEEGQGHPLPRNEQLWEYISQELSSTNRIESLKLAFNEYISDLYHKCLNAIEARYLSAKMDADGFDAICKLQLETSARIERAIPEFIYPTFERISKIIPRKFQEARKNVENRIYNEIEASYKLDKEEMVAFTNSHLLPHTIRQETIEIQKYIEIELDDLNRKVDDYLQKERIEFNNKITITLQTYLGAASSSLLSGVLKNYGTNSLQQYFLTFGGAGGANAGIANAASHTLKQVGNLFGKTFSKATHNALKRTLSKIGATSMKAVGVIVAVLVEILFEIHDILTWKRGLREKTSEGLDKWLEETCPVVLKDIDKLRDVNIETIRRIAYESSHTFESNRPVDFEKCEEEYIYSKQIGTELGIA